ANGSTFYDDALTKAQQIFAHDGKLTGSGTQNVSYFLSDGEPSANHGVNSTEQNDWHSFLTTNSTISFALGISDSHPQETNLEPIPFDPAPRTHLPDTPIIATTHNH